jgi:hypothetical protein
MIAALVTQCEALAPQPLILAGAPRGILAPAIGPLPKETGSRQRPSPQWSHSRTCIDIPVAAFACQNLGPNEEERA